MKRRLLFVCGHMEIGGVEKSLLDFLTHLSPYKYELYLLLVESSKGEYVTQIPGYVHVKTLNSDKFEGPFLKVFSESVKKRNWLSMRFKLAQLGSRYIGIQAYSILKKDVFKGIKFDVSIGFKPDHCSYISTFATNAHHRLTWWHHGDFLIERKKYITLCSANDKVICVSQGTKQLLAGVGVKEDSIFVIPNMLDVENIKQRASQFIPTYPRDKLIIVSVSRLAPEKQFDLIPSIASSLKEKLPNKFQWHIIGDGPMRETIEKEIEKHSVQDYIIMHGNQSNPYPYIANADLFVHPSRIESQGLAVLEALSLGIPIVTGSTIGTEEYISDGVNGLIVQPDKQHLYNAIKRIIDSKELYQLIKSQSKVPIDYLPRSVIAKLEEVISKI